MEWSQEQVNEARQRAYVADEDQMGLSDAAVRVIMDRAAELFDQSRPLDSAMWPLIIAELRQEEHTGALKRLREACEARDAFGRQKYGTPLQVENGRNALQDGLEEALDGMAYTRQHYEQLRASPHTPPSRVRSALKLHFQARAFAVSIIEEMGACEREGL